MDEQVEDQKTVRQRFVLIVVALGVGWVWIKYGADAVLSIALIMGVVWVSLRLGPGTGKRSPIPYGRNQSSALLVQATRRSRARWGWTGQWA